jgi:hypothetical protein
MVILLQSLAVNPDIDFSNFLSKILKDIVNSRYTTSVVTPVVNVIYV